MKPITCTKFAAVLLCLALVACGGGSGGTPPSTAGGTTTTIQGVSTPSSVSVVTAKNAQ
jgi:ABC-type glycerol-3-phosphate transport system substrate-binding protein